jgi:hypothetical protein
MKVAVKPGAGIEIAAGITASVPVVGGDVAEVVAGAVGAVLGPLDGATDAEGTAVGVLCGVADGGGAVVGKADAEGDDVDAGAGVIVVVAVGAIVGDGTAVADGTALAAGVGVEDSESLLIANNAIRYVVRPLNAVPAGMVKRRVVPLDTAGPAQEYWYANGSECGSKNAAKYEVPGVRTSDGVVTVSEPPALTTSALKTTWMYMSGERCATALRRRVVSAAWAAAESDGNPVGPVFWTVMSALNPLCTGEAAPVSDNWPL